MHNNKRRMMVAGNWKMNGNKQLVSDMQQALQTAVEDIDIVVCPPSVYLSMFQPNGFLLGAQNTSQYDSGAYTGEISVSMLAECQVSHIIVGHSERRGGYGETNQIVADKAAAVIAAGLTPIVCVGEPLEVRESGELYPYLQAQLDAVLTRVDKPHWSKLVIAYEPIWAIGTGNTATPEQAQQVHEFLRGLVADSAPDIAEKMTFLYGGSVNAANASSLFGQADIDGGLVGGASLKPADFLAICQAANELR